MMSKIIFAFIVCLVKLSFSLTNQTTGTMYIYNYTHHIS